MFHPFCLLLSGIYRDSQHNSDVRPPSTAPLRISDPLHVSTHPPPPSRCWFQRPVPSAQASVRFDYVKRPAPGACHRGMAGWPVRLFHPRIGQGHLGRRFPPQQRPDLFYLTPEPAPRLLSPGSRSLASMQATVFRPCSPTTL